MTKVEVLRRLRRSERLYRNAMRATTCDRSLRAYELGRAHGVGEAITLLTARAKPRKGKA